ncbi:hypothetical protein IQ06DRAFT_90516 [Phaeosphaeriaceae sp. SRC1lsM3a]|nr:hypothetical protein IQ06DRAFT_90516 [Stagonospora sp. SRC1lsM3a]
MRTRSGRAGHSLRRPIAPESDASGCARSCRSIGGARRVEWLSFSERQLKSGVAVMRQRGMVGWNVMGLAAWVARARWGQGMVIG